MRPVQIAVLSILVVAAATYVALRVVRSTRADDQFFGTLLDRLMDVLGAKGFTLRNPLIIPRRATFQGSSSIVELIWDSHEREILLRQRTNDAERGSTGQTLASAHVPNEASRSQYNAATEAVLSAAESINGAA